jgi:hypothetical protein
VSLAYCQEAKELLEIYGLAVHEIVCLHREQFESVIGGDLDSVRFDDLIHIANDGSMKRNMRTCTIWRRTAAHP